MIIKMARERDGSGLREEGAGVRGWRWYGQVAKRSESSESCRFDFPGFISGIEPLFYN